MQGNIMNIHFWSCCIQFGAFQSPYHHIPPKTLFYPYNHFSVVRVTLSSQRMSIKRPVKTVDGHHESCSHRHHWKLSIRIQSSYILTRNQLSSWIETPQVNERTKMNAKLACVLMMALVLVAALPHAALGACAPKGQTCTGGPGPNFGIGSCCKDFLCAPRPGTDTRKIWKNGQCRTYDILMKKLFSHFIKP